MASIANPLISPSCSTAIPARWCRFLWPPKGEPQYLNIEFPQPFTAQGLTVSLDVWNAHLDTVLEVSDDGEHYRHRPPGDGVVAGELRSILRR